MASLDTAIKLHRHGRIEEAEQAYRQILVAQPDHPGALHLLGAMRQKQARHEDALELIGRAIRVRPGVAVYHNNYGAALLSLSRFAEAEASIRRALAIRPDYADALANLGLAQASLGEDAAAVTSLRAALALQPGHVDATRRLASLVRHLGLDDAAIRLYEETLPHCSAAALAVPFSKLRVFAAQIDTLRQSPPYGSTSVDGQGEMTYDGRNPFSDQGSEIGGQRPDVEVARGACSPGFSRNPPGIPPTMVTWCPRGTASARIPPEGGTTSAGVSPTQAAGTAAPLVSVIVPVYNGAATIQRAIRSLQAQTFSDWEAVLVDDASCDGTWDVLQSLAAEDVRIQTVRLAENGGAGRARNAGLRLGRGQFIAYLDADDEYYAGYLEQMAAAQDKGDVFMFPYDMAYEDGPPGDRAQDWDPRRLRRILFAFNPAVPLATAHRRSLVERVGGFNELLWRQEDWDFWKRLARAGARFVFLPSKSGVYHVRPGSLSRNPRLTVRQRETIRANWAAGRPIFEDGEGKSGISTGSPRPHPNPLSGGEGTEGTHHAPRDGLHHAERDEYKRKIGFVSPHCLIDFTSAAATAVLAGLQLLAGAGFRCEAFCGTLLNDDGQDVTLDQVLAALKAPYTVRNARIGPFGGRMIFTAQGGVPVTLFRTASPHGIWRDEEEVAAFATACELFLKRQRPDAVWTYGDDPVSREILELLKRLDIPIVFALHDLTHHDTAALAAIDYAVVPSEFARRHYWETLGLACQVLPPVVDPGQWHPNGLAPVYREFFGSITHQPGPPLVPREAGVGL